METFTVQEAQEKLAALIQELKQNQGKFLITSPEGNAVLVSEETYNNLMITLELLSTPIFLENAQE